MFLQRAALSTRSEIDTLGQPRDSVPMADDYMMNQLSVFALVGVNVMPDSEDGEACSYGIDNVLVRVGDGDAVEIASPFSLLCNPAFSVDYGGDVPSSLIRVCHNPDVTSNVTNEACHTTG